VSSPAAQALNAQLAAVNVAPSSVLAILHNREHSLLVIRNA
jgi:hypothetical protein